MGAARESLFCEETPVSDDNSTNPGGTYSGLV